MASFKCGHFGHLMRYLNVLYGMQLVGFAMDAVFMDRRKSDVKPG
jgi:hypothetical protein